MFTITSIVIVTLIKNVGKPTFIFTDFLHFILPFTTQTEALLNKQKEKNEDMATELHYTVGKTIRDAIEKLGGTMPEDLPTPDKSLKEIEGEQNIKAKQIQS